MNCKTSLLELARLRQILSEATVKDNGEELLRADWAALGFQESQSLRKVQKQEGQVFHP